MSHPSDDTTNADGGVNDAPARFLKAEQELTTAMDAVSRFATTSKQLEAVRGSVNDGVLRLAELDTILREVGLALTHGAESLRSAAGALESADIERVERTLENLRAALAEHYERIEHALDRANEATDRSSVELRDHLRAGVTSIEDTIDEWVRGAQEQYDELERTSQELLNRQLTAVDELKHAVDKVHQLVVLAAVLAAVGVIIGSWIWLRG